ncbi:ATP-dependent DNA helicase [Nemorincola caseinilytica]|uniref:DNA 3'-5' helicase n=1 Tax=Nemorincola caseinilytica TaxID=2054315 RepID=A0ABP8N6Q7_9BACT
MSARTPISEDMFQERYSKLNDRQREAVDTIYGTVMVIAGPGTGKTEVLAMRIAALLRSEAQVQPQEILCLTYTDEATNSMRRRLLQVIGNAAHKVNIHTFHGFCNMVIQSNGEYFSRRELQPISDLERADLMHQMLEELPQGHLLRRLSGDIYYDTGKLGRLFDMMKREHLTPEHISAAIDEYLASLPQREDYVYKRASKGYQKGDLKQDKIDEETRKMESTRAAAMLFHTYTRMMKEAGRYDFNDMILWVLEAFNTHTWLLQSYQERYQFILVDEFQDTNGAQNELLTMLSAYWENPNLFVVGDDDQSIYEFQGARIRNITDLYERHRDDIKVIVLPHNYRSSQAVIDRAIATINNNRQRLINQLHALQLNKNIIAANDRFRDGKDTVTPVIREYPNLLQEEADVVMQIEALQQKGVPLREIAVLYAQHKQAENIIALMERKGLLFNVKKKVNVMDLPLTAQVLNVLRYLDAERRKKFDGEELLFEIMHAPYFGIDPNDIAMLALYMQQSRKETGPLKWRLLLSNPLLIESLGLASAKAMHRLGNALDDWERQQLALPLPLLVEKIVHESGIVAYLLTTTDHVWALQALNTLFSFVKETWAREPRIRPRTFLEIVDRMESEKISVDLERVIQSDNGVYFYTAHSSKGNEFEHVFLVGCTKAYWEKKQGGRGDYKMPETITATEDDMDSSYKEEVARRLFYVALTRAKKHLHVSYALQDNTGKPLEHSAFIDEISTSEEREQYKVPQETIIRHLEWAMQPIPEVRIKIANAEWIEKVLQQFAMSATQLAKFLRCPLEFYYETILRVPTQRKEVFAYGIAIHYALERMYIEMKKANGVWPTKEEVQNAFRSELFRESSGMSTVQYERRLEMGLDQVSAYYDHYIDKLHKEVEVELKVPRYYLDGVPITGKIDRIELYGDGCIVVDYKTGDPDQSAAANLAPPNEKAPMGGDYWRQMVFYKLLLENYEDRSWLVKSGIFDYVQRTKSGDHKQYVVPMFKQDEDIVRAQLKDAYGRIMNHEFDRGCGKEECHWCNFARRYELIRRDDEPEMDDE